MHLFNHRLTSLHNVHQETNYKVEADGKVAEIMKPITTTLSSSTYKKLRRWARNQILGINIATNANELTNGAVPAR